MVSPVTVSGLAVPVAEKPPAVEYTVYEVIGLPPFDTGGEKVTVACLTPAVAVPMIGDPGVVKGVTAAEAAEAAPVPTAFVAVTVNV